MEITLYLSRQEQDFQSDDVAATKFIVLISSLKNSGTEYFSIVKNSMINSGKQIL